MTQMSMSNSHTNRNKYILFIYFTFITVLLTGCTITNEDGIRTDQNIESEDNRSEALVIHYLDFIDKDPSFFIEKLGQPIGGEEYQDLPTTTNWHWEGEEYVMSISFDKGETVKYISTQFLDGECEQTSDLYLKRVGLNYPTGEPNIARDGHLYRWEPYTERFDRLNLYCNEQGTNVVLISKVL